VVTIAVHTIINPSQYVQRRSSPIETYHDGDLHLPSLPPSKLLLVSHRFLPPPIPRKTMSRSASLLVPSSYTPIGICNPSGTLVIVQPDVSIVKTTTTNTVVLNTRVFAPLEPAASAIPTVPLRPAQKHNHLICMWQLLVTSIPHISYEEINRFRYREDGRVVGVDDCDGRDYDEQRFGITRRFPTPSMRT
jgi:hypothetical protein